MLILQKHIILFMSGNFPALAQVSFDKILSCHDLIISPQVSSVTSVETKKKKE